MKAALIDQRITHHELLVQDFMVRNDTRLERLDRQIGAGFENIRIDNAKQTAIISKWGTIRDTLVWVAGALAVIVGGLWAVFTWATGHLWTK